MGTRCAPVAGDGRGGALGGLAVDLPPVGLEDLTGAAGGEHQELEGEHGREAGNATTVTASTRCAGPALALRP